ncbi:DUF3445 domain-containing protein [Octadecabacter sp. CECT 8868]|uniref:heme-dependent oxidative N-demethylase family protein n=1 Tax=Octadecabacter algicola TaxID=2909342 RepID=UPI001F3ED590|nr:DUF3445 domain-containing protein [Octadecabacter algicola]MCF2903512.1 DUF3445 domain-containing protein [Octadecabacter algicola]
MAIELNMILQAKMPNGQLDVAAARLPAVRPVIGDWLFHDDAYGAQMVLKRHLLQTQERDVYAQLPEGLAASRGFLAMALEVLPDGFQVDGGQVTCPDGVQVTLEWDAPLWSVGQILQQDVCILEKRGDEHVLTGAVLCFPASWTLAQKIGKPLIAIHEPVPEYDAQIATRVQRLFDGVQAERPIWRANALRYDDAALYQPRLENDPRPVGKSDAPYMRSERQTILRLPQPDAVAFVIHTTVVKTD